MITSDMSSLDEALESMNHDLAHGPASIAAQSGIPFAILRYSPAEEFEFRRKIRLFANQLQQQRHLSVHFISLSKLVWRAVSDTMEDLHATERLYGFDEAQHKELESQIEGPDKHGKHPQHALFKEIISVIQSAPSKPDLVFLVRAGGLAPHVYRSSALLNDLQQAGFITPTVLCYPGSAVAGTDLRFYDMPAEEGLGTYNYRVKIYGTR